MKNFLTLVLCLSAFVATAQTKLAKKQMPKNYYQLPADIQADEYLPQTIIVKVKPQYRHWCSIERIAEPQLQAALQLIEAKSVRKMFPAHQPPAKKFNEIGEKYADLSLIYTVKYQSSVRLDLAINLLLATQIVEYAVPHFIHKIVSYTPNDSLIAQQWHLDKIKAFDAWGIQKGDTNIIIGIVDSGTDINHPDLVGNYYRNRNDTIDGIDNDGDGMIDNFLGWDVGGADFNNPVPDNNPGITGNNNNHGSHVGGIAAATTDNALGTAGVGFRCKHLPIKAAADNDTRANGTGLIIGGFSGIVAAADMGAHIINCSWGGRFSLSFEQDIIDYATINKGALVVAAAGNNGLDTRFYPAALKGVMAITGTESNDRRRSTFNYGYYISACAPGHNIFSTIYDDSYTPATGTSMASPVAAGAAAIVKSHFPNFTPAQIRLQLRNTCDNIYNVTGNQFDFIRDKLGKGRINLYRALTETTPGVAIQTLNFSDNNDNSFQIGDTVYMAATFINHLHPTTNLQIKLSSPNPNIKVLDSVLVVGALGNLQTVQTSTPFRAVLLPNIAVNSLLHFKFSYQDGSYDDFEYYSDKLIINYLNVAVNKITTSVSSIGRIGYVDDEATEGSGFQFYDNDLIYEMGLMMIASEERLANTVRVSTSSQHDQDFHHIIDNIKPIPSVQNSDFASKAIFDDSIADWRRLNVTITHHAYAWSNTPDDKYVIVEYEVKNNSDTATLDSVYVGLYADHDIQDYSKNRANWDAVRKMGYAFNTEAQGLYAGIAVLGNATPTFYAIDNDDVPTSGNVGVYNGFTEAEKRITLSSNLLKTQAGASGTGNDISFTIGAGMYQIAPLGSIKVAFALLADSNLAGLQASAEAAQIRYQTVTSLTKRSNNLQMPQLAVFPNPAKQYFNVKTEKTSQLLQLTDLTGKVIAQYKPNQTEYRLDVQHLPSGIYWLRANIEGQVVVKKVIIQ
jgi:subtilisin family serine protease